MFKSLFQGDKRLDMFGFSSNSKQKKLDHTLCFSLYQEAYEYVKLRQGEDINFNDEISNIRETSRQKYYDLVALNSKLKRESNLENTELNQQSSEITKIQTELKEMKSDIKDIKSSIQLLCSNMKL